MYGHFILNFRRVFLFACVCLALLWGCDNSSEPTQKPKVVRKKIQITPSEKEKKENNVNMNSSSGVTENGKKESVEDFSGQYGKPSETAESVAHEGKKKETESIKPFDVTPPTGERPIDNVMKKQFASKGPPVYNPEGKVDPFMPLFKKESPEEEMASEKPKKKKRIPRTPLERIDLSQLELVGIVSATGSKKALVEESSGKGYIVTIGTYMGRNGGRVTNILSDRIVVEEEVIDVLGKSKIKKKVLKLQKPFGEN